MMVDHSCVFHCRSSLLQRQLSSHIYDSADDIRAHAAAGQFPENEAVQSAGPARQASLPALLERQDSANYQPCLPALAARQDSAHHPHVLGATEEELTRRDSAHEGDFEDQPNSTSPPLARRTGSGEDLYMRCCEE